VKWLIVFDLNGTIAGSKQPLSPEMAATLSRLLARIYPNLSEQIE
jgi:phosphomannomutase|tara:strand:+ start:165 stop:299 length:135 start_codon:yes stop_codon:yes gene_type:complete